MFHKILFCNDMMAPITPPPLDSENFGSSTIVIIICVAILCAFIALIGLTTYLLVKRSDKKKHLLNQKKEPVAFTNSTNKDITIIATDNYSEIQIQFTLYDKDNAIIKQYIVKELDFTLNEQRIIANLKDFDAYKIGYKIITYK